jgi:Tc5 transposase DNA-binding domain
MPITYQEIEERVIRACISLECQEIPNIAATARQYDAPEGRVRRRFLGKAGSRIDAGGQNKALDEAADRALCLYIDLTDDIGLPIREKTLVIAANAILRNRRDPNSKDNPPTVSQNWASRWLSRHPEYEKRAKQPLAADRKKSHDPAAIQK